jgi:hypothetical protein
MFAVETGEEVQRYRRLPAKMRPYRNRPSEDVKELWKERGDWKASWQDPRGGKDYQTIIGWNWPHESPSAEPEELSGLEDLATLELTTSEAEALEAVRPPSPSPPPGPWPSLLGPCYQNPALKTDGGIEELQVAADALTEQKTQSPSTNEIGVKTAGESPTRRQLIYFLARCFQYLPRVLKELLYACRYPV